MPCVGHSRVQSEPVLSPSCSEQPWLPAAPGACKCSGLVRKTFFSPCQILARSKLRCHWPVSYRDEALGCCCCFSPSPLGKRVCMPEAGEAPHPRETLRPLRWLQSQRQPAASGEETPAVLQPSQLVLCFDVGNGRIVKSCPGKCNRGSRERRGTGKRCQPAALPPPRALGTEAGGRVLGWRQQGSTALLGSSSPRAEPTSHGKCSREDWRNEKTMVPFACSTLALSDVFPFQLIPTAKNKRALFVRSQPGRDGPWLPPGISHTPDRPRSPLHGGCPGPGRWDFSRGPEKVPAGGSGAALPAPGNGQHPSRRQLRQPGVCRAAPRSSARSPWCWTSF